jgi:hypothetical protein
MSRWLNVVALAAGLVAVAPAFSQQPMELEGQKLEPTVSLGGQTLQLNGAGLRKRAIFKVYVGGLYVPQKTKDPAVIIGDKGPRRIALRMLRDVEAQSFIDSFNDGLKANNSEAQLTALKAQTEALTATMKSIGEAKTGDALNFDYTPDSGTRITVNGQPKGNAIPGADFFAAVLRIWLGDKPVDDNLKKGMLGA